MGFIEHEDGFWGVVVGVLAVIFSLATSAHAVLHKRDSRAAVLWVGFIWLSPIVGAVFYVLLGVNRIRRRAVLLRGGLERYQSKPSAPPCEPAKLVELMPPEAMHLEKLANLVTQVVSRPLLPANQVHVLVNGDEAFPQMLEAIATARESLSLATYIFDNDPAGRQFADALQAAAARGVEVRVLIDDAGARYSFPSILSVLRKKGVRVARFMPRFVLWRFAAMNLRSHRKILVADGRVGFTGGMNIRQGNLLRANPGRPVQDTHFRVEGPVVAQLQEAFADDWFFCTGEALRGETWFPALQPAGSILARGIVDGPDEDFDKLRWAILGAINSAHSRLKIVTPYFLPDQALISALNLAAMRGVEVDIVLPSVNNLPFMNWASAAHWWQMLKWGCRIWLTPPPFDHSKIMVVDGHWSLLGSANLDPRSLRLNFEFNLECYGDELAEKLEARVEARIAKATAVTLEQMDQRSLPVRLRDGVARLFTPFL